MHNPKEGNNGYIPKVPFLLLELVSIYIECVSGRVLNRLIFSYAICNDTL